MKKLHYHRKLYLDRHAARRPKPTVQRRRQSKSRQKPLDLRSMTRPVNVPAPQNFYLASPDCRELLFQFFDRIDEALRQGRRVNINFEKTSGLHPCGTLVFMARLDLWLEKYPGMMTAGYPTDEVVEQLFQHLAVLEKLGRSPRHTISSERVAYWNFYSGAKADLSGFKDTTLSIIKGIEHPNQILFADCLNEAVCNTVGHAYKYYSEDEVPSHLRRWWIFSEFREDRMFVAIYDAGHGIPGTLRRKPEWVEYLKVRHYNDDRIIQSAIVSNRTSTLQPERGKGLPEMLEFSQSLKGGGLSILSSKGAFYYDASTGTPRRRKFALPLPGTLVQWAIPFRKEQGNGNNELLNS
jgi:hypothetical protein